MSPIEIRYSCPICGGTNFLHEDNPLGDYEVTCIGCGFKTDINEVKRSNKEKAEDISNRLAEALKKRFKR